MPTANFEQIAAATKASTEALTKSGSAAIAGYQELAKAYQALATKNAEKLTASMQALASVKNPAEFIELQQKLVKEGVEAAVADSRNIAELTQSVFTQAFEPVKVQVEALQKSVTK
ncbi:phasin family protein [Magnetospirillum sulfuroxidans]|uniref:Phasin family protein n=1 Tax=Magnetospirillum sulfuroxidans TaxID=611300 RepID=A0ABS5I7Y4_9PROT|nr:phasin family protein [Magnetospirillum sulfuroxidans]MBR9970257.1 phasin family protein [Magnetospirillum sulfuroxidans]